MFSRFFHKKPQKSTSTQMPIEPPSNPFTVTWLPINSEKIHGKFALSQCSQTKKYERKKIRETHKISTIVCLLNKFELRTIGVNLDDYIKACEALKIRLIIYPIVEMGIPTEDFHTFRKGVLKEIVNELNLGHNLLIHCRGGIGRAGTIACCVLLEIGEKNSPEEGVRYLRGVRDKRCVESRKQFDFICDFFRSIC